MPGLALLSVSDKTGMVEFAVGLVRLGYEITATGGTASALRAAGVPVTPVESLTRVAEMLDGRVKTLHPAVHGGLLARRDVEAHMRALWQAGIRPIDVLAVNLYPFREAVASGKPFDACLEEIDIGGPALLRSAAKNHADVAVVCDPADYPALLTDLRARSLTADRRKALAQKAFSHTAGYDAAIAGWLAGESVLEQDTPAPPGATVVAEEPAPTLQLETAVAVQAPLAVVDAEPPPEGVLRVDLGELNALRYGENPHQAAWLARDLGARLVEPVGYRLHQGKPLSYNNVLDADAAWALVADLPPDRAGAVVVKHGNPCGVGSVATSVAGGLLRALDTDPTSAFGGIVAVNRTFDLSAARALGDRFVEVILAPAFEEEALEALAAKPNVRVLSMGAPGNGHVRQTVRATAFGVLVQEVDRAELSLVDARVATQAAPTDAERRALALAWRVCKHVRSNAIVIGDENGTVGIGAGQMSRVDSATIAVGKMRKGFKGIAAASDAFFPFADGLELLVKSGVRAVVQPGGSQRDAEVIAAANAAGIAMLLTGSRHFRH
jgi:phosphoribosylaminoimidazolecarboxamide formyltransferase/IMP cyclohydrolase